MNEDSIRQYVNLLAVIVTIAFNGLALVRHVRIR
jgi:hypothetical protein